MLHVPHLRRKPMNLRLGSLWYLWAEPAVYGKWLADMVIDIEPAVEVPIKTLYDSLAEAVFVVVVDNIVVDRH